MFRDFELYRLRIAEDEKHNRRESIAAKNLNVVLDVSASDLLGTWLKAGRMDVDRLGWSGRWRASFRHHLTAATELLVAVMLRFLNFKMKRST